MSKCYILSVKKKSNFYYQLDKTILKEVQSNQYLGIIFASDLKWTIHIDRIANKASSMLGFLQRNLKHCPQNCRKQAYLALVRSTLQYGAIVWDNNNKTDIDKLECIQRRAARFIKQDYHTKDPGCVTAMLQALQLPKLQDWRQQLRLALMYKVVEGN